MINRAQIAVGAAKGLRHAGDESRWRVIGDKIPGEFEADKMRRRRMAGDEIERAVIVEIGSKEANFARKVMRGVGYASNFSRLPSFAIVLVGDSNNAAIAAHGE